MNTRKITTMNKMLSMFSLLLAVTFTSVFVGPVLAQDNTPVVNQRQGNQRKRVRQGIRSGELTRGEVRSIRKDQQEVREEKREAKADGVVTREERREIKQEQNQASRRIYRKKHNRRDRD
ncbi:MAG: hypothetical protein SF339_05870 [Blastocatellia bacterium]|nr:hypothetical protein [Blastocatellia bacterium]